MTLGQYIFFFGITTMIIQYAAYVLAIVPLTGEVKWVENAGPRKFALFCGLLAIPVAGFLAIILCRRGVVMDGENGTRIHTSASSRCIREIKKVKGEI